MLDLRLLLLRSAAFLSIAGGAALAALTQRRPLTALNDLIMADGLSSLALALAGLLALTVSARWQRLGQLAALWIGLLCGHLGGLALAVLLSLALSERWAARGGGLALAVGFGLIGFSAGDWALTTGGAGLNSLSFLLLLVGAALAAGALDLPRPDPASFDPLAALIGLAALLRLFSVGPWNLGWQFAALLVGATYGLSAAWRAVNSAAADQTEEWIARALSGLALVGIGCAAPAGVVAASLLLIQLTLRRLAQPCGGIAAWAGWILSGVVPGSLGFVALWAISAAAMAAGIAALAMTVWGAALLLMLAAGRQIHGRGRIRSGIAAGVSLALGLAAPALLRWWLRPLSDHLQGGLTPYGALEPWGWAGLLALNAGAQPVATAPGLALLALMLLLGALAWLIARWRALRLNETGERGHE